MNNVIDVDFNNCEEGYILNGKKVEGIYIQDFAASIDGSDVVIGLKDGKSITGQTLTMDEMNRFCLMWLCIFDESVIAKD